MAEFDLDTALERAIGEPTTRRAEVLHAAERLFAERGFEGVRIRDVAAQAEVNVATVHLHWKSKAVLYEAVCRLHARQLFDFATRLGSVGAEDLQKSVDAAFDFMGAHPFVASIALQSVADQTPPEIPSLFTHDVSVFQAVADRVRETRGSTAPDMDSMLTVLAVFYFAAVLFCDSPLQRALLGGSVYDDGEVRDRVAGFAAAMVAKLVGRGS